METTGKKEKKMKRSIRWIATLVTCVLGMSALTGCGGSGNTGESKQLTVFTALPSEEIPAYVEAFRKDTGIDVQFVRLSAGEMTVRVKGEKGHPTAALMWGGSTDNYIAAMQDDLLEPYQSASLKEIPEKYHDPKKTWNPFYIGAIGFACNTDWFKKQNMELPKSWKDLLDPRLKGQIMMAHPATSGTSYTILATILQLFGEKEGWEYMKQLHANIRQYTKSGAAPANSAGLGEAAVAIVFSHDGLKPRAEGYPIEVTFPSEGTGYEVGAMALIKGADPAQRKAAETFIDWCLSKRGQEVFRENGSNRLPLNTQAAVAEGLTPIEKLKVIDYDADWAGTHKKEFLDQFSKQILDPSNVKS